MKRGINRIIEDDKICRDRLCDKGFIVRAWLL
jgi:hypothetical protein